PGIRINAKPLPPGFPTALQLRFRHRTVPRAWNQLSGKPTRVQVPSQWINTTAFLVLQWPWFLPDGRRFVYVARGTNGSRELSDSTQRPSASVNPGSYVAKNLMMGNAFRQMFKIPVVCSAEVLCISGFQEDDLAVKEQVALV